MILVPTATLRRELIIQNSRFISTLSPVDSVQEARAFIQTIRKEFPDASHHVPAFIIGGGNTRTDFCSDDGEPSGTSGRPLLAVLKGSGMGNVAVVVSRYFGGTLLGTGGLVKAYSEAGKVLIESVGRAVLVPAFRARLRLPYSAYERVRQIIESVHVVVLIEDFLESVTIMAEIPEAEWETFLTRVAGLGAGSILLEKEARVMLKKPLPQ